MAGKLSGRFCSPASGGGPENADFSTPRTRAAMTRGPPSGLKPASTLAGSGVLISSTGISPLRSLLVRIGVKSIEAFGAFDRKPEDATVTCCRSAVAGSSWLMPSRMLNHAT